MVVQLLELSECKIQGGGVQHEVEVTTVEADDRSDFDFVVGIDEDEVLRRGGRRFYMK